MNKEIKHEISQIRKELNELQNKKTAVSLQEYEDLKNYLKIYKAIPELEPIALMMEREIDKLVVYC